MSLLEDVFLEDEAGEAQELERVIEGEEYDERPLSPNSDDNEEKDDEAEEDKRRVDPSQAKAKRVVKNPRFILNPARLTGPRGIQVIPDHFKDFKFKGKGHEKEDLDMVLKKLEHWAYRLYPKFGFHDCLKKIEMLGKKRLVMVHLTKIRSDQFVSDELVVQRDSSDDEAPEAPVQEDEFDKLLQQQIELARSTPAPGSVKKTANSTPSVDRSLMMPKATSSPSISDEQRERMLRNRRLAEERRLAKLKNKNPLNEIPKENNVESGGTKEDSDEVIPRKHNRSHVFDSSDDEETSVNRSIAVDIHSSTVAEIDNVREKETLKQKSQITSEIDGTKDDEIIARKHKSNAIDSSDEDELNISVQVDESNKHTEVSKQNSTEVPEYSDNTQSNAVFARKRNRINAIDSSDDDETIVDQSIANENRETNIIVDISTNTTNTNNITDGLNPMTADGDSTPRTIERTEVPHKDVTSTQAEIISKNVNSNTVCESDNDIKISELSSNFELKSSNNEDSKDKTKINEENTDMMDVDFSEDF